MTICGLIDLPVAVMAFVFPLVITLLAYNFIFKKHFKKKKWAILFSIFIFFVLMFAGFALADSLGFGCTGPEREFLPGNF